MQEHDITHKLEHEKEKLFRKFLDNMPFYDMTTKNLQISSQELGLSKDRYLLFFSDKQGIISYFHEVLNKETLAEIRSKNIADMRVRDRIKTCLEIHFNLMNKYRFAINKFLSYNLVSLDIKSSYSHIWKTVSLIWEISLDKSTDYNYYTKRIILAKLYLKVFYFWLSIDEGDISISEFLDKEIEKILKLNKQYLKEKLIRLKNKVPFIRLIDIKNKGV